MVDINQNPQNEVVRNMKMLNLEMINNSSPVTFLKSFAEDEPFKKVDEKNQNSSRVWTDSARI